MFWKNKVKLAIYIQPLTTLPSFQLTPHFGKKGGTLFDFHPTSVNSGSACLPGGCSVSVHDALETSLMHWLSPAHRSPGMCIGTALHRRQAGQECSDTDWPTTPAQLLHISMFTSVCVPVSFLACQHCCLPVSLLAYLSACHLFPSH